MEQVYRLRHRIFVEERVTTSGEEDDDGPELAHDPEVEGRAEEDAGGKAPERTGDRLLG